MARQQDDIVDMRDCEAEQVSQHEVARDSRRQEAGRKSGPHRLAQGAAAIGIILGVTVLGGWWLNVPGLQSVWPGGTRIPPSGGLISLLLGVALALKIEKPVTGVRRAVTDLAGVAAAGIGLLTLFEYILGWNAGVDQWIFGDRLTGWQRTFSGRLSYPGALIALWLGLGIALLDVRIRGVSLTQLFVVFATLIGLLALIGHICSAPEFYGQVRGKGHAGIPPQMTMGLLLVGAGLLCARPERGLIAVLWSFTPGGVLARWLLLVPAAGLFLTGIVYLIFTHVIPVDRAVRTWAMGLSNLFFVTVPIWAAAQALHKTGLERDRAHHELEERVQQRTAELREARDRLAEQAVELERRVQERTAKLAETVGDLEAFSYSVAHDMRAPLRGMQGFSHLLLQEHAGNLSLEARDYLERIANSASRMDLLIQDALDYTQVLRAEMELKPVDLDRLARHLVASFPGWQPPRAEIQIEGVLPAALGHEGSIVQCLSNLVGNAVKFVTPGTTPRVRIWGEAVDTMVRIYIEDNGIGIAEKDRERVFRMFERLNAADEYEGTGIGLAVVRKAVERMKGRCDFESEPGRGTRFWVELKKASVE